MGARIPAGLGGNRHEFRATPTFDGTGIDINIAGRRVKSLRRKLAGEVLAGLERVRADAAPGSVEADLLASWDAFAAASTHRAAADYHSVPFEDGGWTDGRGTSPAGTCR